MTVLEVAKNGFLLVKSFLQKNNKVIYNEDVERSHGRLEDVKMSFIISIAVVTAVFILLIVAVLGQSPEFIEFAVTVAWTLVIMTSIILMMSNLSRKTTFTNKAVGMLISVAGTIITMLESKIILSELVNSSSLFDGTELNFIIFSGICVWYVSIIMCTYANYSCVTSNEDNKMRFAKAICLIIGSLALSSMFGLLGEDAGVEVADCIGSFLRMARA